MTHTVSRKPFYIALMLLSLGSLILNVIGISWGLPSQDRSQFYPTDFSWYQGASEAQKLYKTAPFESYHPDEGAIFIALSNMKPQRFDLNPHFFYYPTLYIYLTGVLIFGCSHLGCARLENSKAYYIDHPDDMAQLYRLGRLLAAVLAALGVFALGITGLTLFGHGIGLLAALFLAIMPVWVRDSHFMLVNIPASSMMVFAAGCAALAFRTKRQRWLWLGALFSGLAASTKYPSGIIILLQIAALLYIGRQQRFTLPRLILGSMGVGVIASLAFLITSPYIVLAFDEFKHELLFLGQSKLGIPNLVTFFDNVVVSEGTALTIVTGAGFLVVLRRIRRWEYFFTFLLVFCGIANAALTNENFIRYTTNALPAFALCAALACSMLFVRLKWRSIAAVAACTVISGVVIWTGLYTFAILRVMASGTDIRNQAAAWIEQNVSAGTPIAIRTSLNFSMPPIEAERYPVISLQDEKSQQLPRVLVYSDHRPEATRDVTLAALQLAPNTIIRTQVFEQDISPLFVFPVSSWSDDWAYNFLTVHIGIGQ